MGKKLAQKIEGELAIVIARLMHGVSAADVATFTKVLQTIIGNAAV
jgi:hypothetical protein